MAPLSGTSSFVGRDADLGELRELLGKARLVTVTGAGGIGKTRLAAELLRTVERAFPDGVAVVELAYLEGGREVAPAVATALATPDRSNRPAVERIKRHLAGRRMLVLVDNCEHVLAAVGDLLAELLADPDGSSFVATSREPLGLPGEQVHMLGPLGLPAEDQRGDPLAVEASEAVGLLIDRARSYDPSFAVTAENCSALVQVCDRLDGLPLAIELAAARLRSLSVEQVLARLDERFTLLTGGARTGLPRHRTLWALVDWSHQLCTEEERLLWARLSVFPGSFDLDAVEAICTDEVLPRNAVLDVLERLITQSIVLAEAGGATMRYRLLVTVREYGADRLDEREGRTLGRRRHRDHFLMTAAEMARDWCGPNQSAWLLAMRRDHANLVAALDWSVSTPGEEQQAARFVALLRYHWVTGHHLSDGRRWGERVLALDPRPTVERAAALGVTAWVCLLQGERADARSHLDECREIAIALGDPILGAHVDHGTALSHFFDGDAADAIPLFEAAAAVHEQAGDIAGAQTALFQLALAQTYAGAPSNALATCARVLAISQERGEQWTRAYALWVAGISHWHQGDLDAAERAARSALALQRGFQDSNSIALTLELLASLASSEGRHERAAALGGAAEAVWGPLGTTIAAFGPGIAADSKRTVAEVDEVLGQVEAGRLRAAQAGLTAMQAADFALDGVRVAGGTRAGPGPLTSRELEVARLVAEGLSNRAIAHRLVISTRTVDGHLERILAKLGFSSRTQVATWATSHAPSA